MLHNTFHLPKFARMVLRPESSKPYQNAHLWYGRWNVLSNTIDNPPRKPNSAKNQFLGCKMVELRSPDLWGAQSDAEFHARPAKEGPEAARAQFRR